MEKMLEKVIRLFCRHRYRKAVLIEPAQKVRYHLGTKYTEPIYSTKCIKCGKTVSGCKSEIKALVRRTKQR